MKFPGVKKIPSVGAVSNPPLRVKTMTLSINNINLQAILKNKDKLIFLVILILALLTASRIYKIQKDKTAALKEEIAVQEQRIALALELAGLDNKISQDAGPYLKKESAWNAQSFHEFAFKAGVKVASISPAKEQNSGFSSAALFELALKGSYHNLAKFISVLESQKDMLQIENISLKGIDNPAEPDILSLTMTVGITYIKGQ